MFDVFFHSIAKKITDTINLRLDKYSIKRTKYDKILGIFVNEHLFWNSFCISSYTSEEVSSDFQS